MNGKNGNGIPKFKGRRTLANVLFDACLQTFVEGKWEIKKSLIARLNVGKLLAETDYDDKTITLHPRVIDEKDPPLQTNLLHELIHVGVSTATEDQVERMEKLMWKHITVDRKEYLKHMIDE